MMDESTVLNYLIMQHVESKQLPNGSIGYMLGHTTFSDYTLGYYQLLPQNVGELQQ